MTPTLDETHDPTRRSWIPDADGHPDFPVQNLPLGVFSPAGAAPRIGVEIGDHILDLAAAAALLPPPIASMVAQTSLNALFASPREDRVALRRRVSALLIDETYRALVEPMLSTASECAMHLPAVIGDYTDFYASIHHANNVGRQFRPDAPLLPNYKWVPIGYHGRASSVRPSGVPVARPNGQRKGPDEEAPEFGPSKRLDYELEIGAWIGPGNAPGRAIPIREAGDHIAGLCLLNDWSARDLQAWEYQPLGPFLAKNFQTTVSAWVVTAEALAPFRMPQPARAPGDPRPLPYLWDDDDQASGAYAIELAVHLSSRTMRDRKLEPHLLSRGPASSLYWTIAQLVAHHASNGCDLRPGDLLGTGTISAPDDSGQGSLLEITRGGAAPLTLPTGETRAFLEDGNEITLSGTARAKGYVPIGFGGCRAVVASAPPL